MNKCVFNDITEGIYSLNKFDKNFENDNTKYFKKILSFIKNIRERELTKRQKDCVELYYAKNIRMSEIARKFGLNRSTVFRHIKRAKKRISEVAMLLLEGEQKFT
jgi:predicted DNA-binding protein YlxM (UPF0122 family)